LQLKYSGRTALVTGGNCDAAIELAKLLIEAGIFVYIGYRQQAGLEKIMEALGNKRFTEGKPVNETQFEPCFLDYGDRNSLDRLFENPGFLPDFLIDFAQGDLESLTASFDEDRAEVYFSENIFCRALLLKAISRKMLQKKSGRMIFISSTAAGLPAPGQGFYAASKNASESLYKNCGIELGKKGIRTVILRPGYMTTGRGRAYIKNNFEKIRKKIPTQKLITPQEVAASVMFFLSDAANGFNACTIALDGGLTAGKEPVN
jgi:3-oxoacyl-[acyl-carrier protein] reductase